MPSLLQAQKARKTVFIIVDGIPANVIEKVSHPHLAAIAKAGGYSRAYVGGKKGTYSETPTISAVGYNSVLTGTWVHKHNVWDNDIKAPNYHYPTLFRYYKEAYPKGKTAIFSSWQDNRTKLVGDQLPATGNLAIDIHYDGLELDTIQYPHDAARNFMSRIDDSVAHIAAQSIRTQAPDLTWVYLEHTDDMGHMFGDSPKFYQAVEAADARVGYIYDAVQYRMQQFKEDWLVIVTTDHGRDSATGHHHGGQSNRERSSWIFTNAKNLNEEFQAPYCAVVDIAPTVARFMQLPIAENNAYEIDGIPFTGSLSISNLEAKQENNQLHITWAALHPKETITLWIAHSNKQKEGGTDNYQKLTTLPAEATQWSIPLTSLPQGMHKIVATGKYNTINCWFIN
ncbi:alkaline phosphatase family protein [Filimonas lacunae]|nr:alkaline phosphatase family protein [Filimonas lacunae]